MGFDLDDRWWRRGVIYEVATISFQDSDGDGKGDLAGFLRRIDYLKWLGVDAVWLTPIYPSPMLVPGFGLGRDPERTPMRWDDSEAGGFTTGKPWLPMLDGRSCNVARQQREERSLLQLYRRLIELRRKQPCLVDGDYQPIRARNDVLGYRRCQGQTQISVGLNIANEPRQWSCTGGVRLMSTHLDRAVEQVKGPILLRANEGIVLLEAP